jgi:glycosyltransferase involved in cell wall biosynthesis
VDQNRAILYSLGPETLDPRGGETKGTTLSLDVLIPHYRDLDGLRRSIASVAEQTWTGDIRMVVVDDGSPDRDYRALQALLENQPVPFTLARNEENRGRPYTRNRLLDSIDSEYVAWLDAGDTWYPPKLDLQFEHISRLRMAGEDMSRIWVTCHYDWQREGARCYPVRQEVKGDQLKELFLGDRLRCYLWTLVAPASTFRAVGEFDEDLPRLQDVDYFIRFVRAGGKLVTPPTRKSMCCYYKSDLGRSAREIRRCNEQIFAKYRTSIEKYGREFQSVIRYNAETLSARYAKNNSDNITRAWYIGRAFVAHPQLAFSLGRRWVGNLLS